MLKRFFILPCFAGICIGLSACATTDNVAKTTEENPEDSAVESAVPVPLEASGNEFDPELNKLLEEARYTDALEFCLANEMTDAANYIAECVLETDELEQFVNAHHGEGADAGELGDGKNDKNDEIRYALARRLLRESHPTKARDFFPKDLLPIFDAYASEMRTGYNFDLSDEERAHGFWNASMIVRANGDALFANFSSLEDIEQREFASDDERARVESCRVRETVATMRLRAATLALYSASLLPNNDERTARILVTAGEWLKARDAASADAFYKLLAIRCPKTEIGKQCIELHWFPPETPWTRDQVWDGIPEEKLAEAPAE